MKAMVMSVPWKSGTEPLQEVESLMPTPGPDEVRIRVKACGVCYSNVHMIKGDWVDIGIPPFTPIIPGHEFVGVIDEMGKNVSGYSLGDRVGVQPLWFTCGACQQCLNDREQLCPNRIITGEETNGGFAEYTLAHSSHLYSIPPEISDVEAAPLMCPGLTAYGAIGKTGLAPGERIAIVGIGGVGHLALQIARALGGFTIAFSNSPHRLALARELKADAVYELKELDPKVVSRTHGEVDYAVVFAPSDDAVAFAIDLVRPGGTVVIGVDCKIGEFSFADEKKIVGSLLGSKKDMEAVLKLAANGDIRAEVVDVPLERANEAIVNLAGKGVRGRIVLTT